MEAEAINQLNNTLSDLEGRSADIRVYLDYAGKKERLEEVVGLSEDPELWNDPKKAQEIGKERKFISPRLPKRHWARIKAVSPEPKTAIYFSLKKTSGELGKSPNP